MLYDVEDQVEVTQNRLTVELRHVLEYVWETDSVQLLKLFQTTHVKPGDDVALTMKKNAGFAVPIDSTVSLSPLHPGDC